MVDDTLNPSEILTLTYRFESDEHSVKVRETKLMIDSIITRGNQRRRQRCNSAPYLYH